MSHAPPQRAEEFPDNAIINCEIVVTSYFHTDGTLRYCCNVGGDPNLAQVLGLCELGKLSLYRDYMEYVMGQGQEDDDGE